MLSRTAESIYWMSRYIERAENVARFIGVNLALMPDLPPGAGEQWMPLVEVTGDQTWFAEHYAVADRANVVSFLVFDRDYPNSILSCLRMARENARSIRDVISTEMWEQVNTFYLMVNAAVERGAEGVTASADFLTQIKMASHLFSGIMGDTMSHNEAWHFGRAGQLMERADKTSRILDVKYFYLLPSAQDVGSPLDEIQWAAVLRSASALEMYRKKFGPIAPARIAEFLVLDREFPRSMHYGIVKAEESLRAISGAPAGTYRNAADQRMGQLRADFAYMHAADILRGGMHEFLDTFQGKLNRVGDAVFESYFALQPIASEGVT